MILSMCPNENGVLSALSPSVYERLMPKMKRVRLEAGSTLYDLGSASEYTWFITKGLVSLFTNLDSGDVVEVAAVGREGIVGLSGITSKNGIPRWSQVQIFGEAFQISSKIMQDILKVEIAFYKPLFEYTHSLSGQIALTVACNQFHNTEQRLARWLLLAQDRISANSIILTHDSMGQILGISRGYVSLAAGALQKNGLILYSRGHINILNRKGLEDAACECYQMIRGVIGSFLTPEAESISDSIINQQS